MIDPLFWLAFSLFLVAISLTAVLVVALPAIQELGRAARSVEKLFDTLSRELPPTLEAIRLTGLEISELTDDVTDSVKSAGQAAKQVEEGLAEVRQQAQTARAATRTVMAGMRAAWTTFTRPDRPRLGSGSTRNDPSSSFSRPVEETPAISRRRERSPDKNDRVKGSQSSSGEFSGESLGQPLHLPQRRLKPSPKSTSSPLDSLPLSEEIQLYEDIER